MTIMTEYGKRLCQGSKNLKDGSLDKLITEYPDHGFAIDRHEAEELFFKVRTPSPAERGLLALLDALMANKIGITKKPAFLEYYAAENPGGLNPMTNNHHKTENKSRSQSQEEHLDEVLKRNRQTVSRKKPLKRREAVPRPAWEINPQNKPSIFAE